MPKSTHCIERKFSQNGILFAVAMNAPAGSTSQRTIDGSAISEQQPQVSLLLNQEAEQSTDSNQKQYGCRDNWGRAKQVQYSNTQRAEYMFELEMYQQETGDTPVSAFVEAKGMDPKFKQFLSKSKGQWNHPKNIKRRYWLQLLVMWRRISWELAQLL